MKELTSVNNPLVKSVNELKLKKYRQEHRCFLIEGLRSIEDAVEAEQVQQIFVVADSSDQRQQKLLQKAAEKNIELYRINASVLKKLSDTETPQGIVAVAAYQEHSLHEINCGETVLILDRISDPGNLGTLIRTADAAGIDSIILLQGCADCFSPKVVRATMGSLFHIPIINDVTEEELLSWAKTNEYNLLVTSLAGADQLYDCELRSKLGIVIGSEANGVSEVILASATKKIFIPMQGKAESLNAAVAGGIVMFESLRQRLAAKDKL